MYTWRELVRLYRLTDPSPPSNLQPRYNICPTTTIDAVIERDSKRVMEQMRWGLVPGPCWRQLVVWRRSARLRGLRDGRTAGRGRAGRLAPGSGRSNLSSSSPPDFAIAGALRLSRIALQRRLRPRVSL